METNVVGMMMLPMTTRSVNLGSCSRDDGTADGSEEADELTVPIDKVPVRGWQFDAGVVLWQLPFYAGMELSNKAKRMQSAGGTCSR